jgi:hypothetical protein
VRDVFIAGVAGIERRADLDRAWSEATELAAVIEDLRGETAELRAKLARKIAGRDSLSLAALAERLSVSKTRAHQLTREEPTDDA